MDAPSSRSWGTHPQLFHTATVADFRRHPGVQAGILAFWLATRWGADVRGSDHDIRHRGMVNRPVAASLRRDTTPGWHGPFLPYFLWLAVPFVLTWLAVDWEVSSRCWALSGSTGPMGLVLLLALVRPWSSNWRNGLADCA